CSFASDTVMKFLKRPTRWCSVALFRLRSRSACCFGWRSQCFFVPTCSHIVKSNLLNKFIPIGPSRFNCQGEFFLACHDERSVVILGCANATVTEQCGDVMKRNTY